MATGFFVRTFREGKWDSVEIDQLTDAELDAVADKHGNDRGWLWAKALAKWIRDNIQSEIVPETKEPEPGA